MRILDEVLVQPVLHSLDMVHVKLGLGRRRPHLLERLLLLLHFLASLSVCVFENEQALFGVLETLGEVVCFSLQTLSFTFINNS